MHSCNEATQRYPQRHASPISNTNSFRDTGDDTTHVVLESVLYLKVYCGDGLYLQVYCGCGDGVLTAVISDVLWRWRYSVLR